MNPIQLLGHDETYVKKFRLYGTKVTFKFTQPPPEMNEIEWLRLGFAKIVNDMKAQAGEDDQLGFTLHTLNLKHKEPGYIAFQKASEINEDAIWEIFGGIVQSNAESIKSTDIFKLEVTKINLPTGSGRTGRVRPGFYNTFMEECKARKGIVVIKITITSASRERWWWQSLK
jgi:hypothetical protein